MSWRRLVSNAPGSSQGQRATIKRALSVLIHFIHPFISFIHPSIDASISLMVPIVSMYDSLPSCAKGRIKRNRTVGPYKIQQRSNNQRWLDMAIMRNSIFNTCPFSFSFMFAFPTTTELLVPNTYTTANIVPEELVSQHVNNLLQANHVRSISCSHSHVTHVNALFRINSNPINTMLW